MNKPIIMALAVLAAFATALTSIPLQSAHAQYPSGSGTATPEQLIRCDELKIDRTICSDVTILAKERATSAASTTYGDNPYGSGTPYFQGAETLAVIGALGAIFGGVAAAFFIKGRGSKPVTT